MALAESAKNLTPYALGLIPGVCDWIANSAADDLSLLAMPGADEILSMDFMFLLQLVSIIVPLPSRVVGSG